MTKHLVYRHTCPEFCSHDGEQVKIPLDIEPEHTAYPVPVLFCLESANVLRFIGLA